MRKRLHKSYLLVVLGLIAICGGAIYLGTVLDDRDAGTRADPVERSDGSLAQDPAPLTLADVKQQPKDSPSEAVMEFWYWGQWGGLENALALYDPEVVHAVGASAMRGALSNRRGYLVTTEPRIVNEVERPEGTAVVTVEGYRKNTRPDPNSFTLVRREGQWLVSFDTMLEAAIDGSAARAFRDAGEASN